MNSTFEFGVGFDVYQDLLVRNLLQKLLLSVFHVSNIDYSIMRNNLQTKDCVDIRVRKFLDDFTTHVPVCGAQLRTSCTATCHNNTAFNHLLQEAKNAQSDTRHSTYQFHLFLWAAIISWIGMAVVVSIADAICFDLLGSYYTLLRTAYNNVIY